jgi:hypothetical protein
VIAVPHYVYGIVGENAKPPVGRGIADAPLHLIGGGAAAALVSDLPAGEVRLGRDEMLAHARVLEAAIANGTVLPMRFGVVMSDADEIRQRLLDDHAAHLGAQLGEFDGKVEVRIRAVYEEKALLREVVREDRLSSCSPSAGRRCTRQRRTWRRRSEAVRRPRNRTIVAYGPRGKIDAQPGRASPLLLRARTKGRLNRKSPPT